MEFLMLFSSPFIMPKTTKIRLVANMTHGAEPVGDPRRLTALPTSFKLHQAMIRPGEKEWEKSPRHSDVGCWMRQGPGTKPRINDNKQMCALPQLHITNSIPSWVSPSQYACPSSFVMTPAIHSLR
jgi:hypothetical protein